MSYIREEFGKEKRWVNWQYVQKEKDKKPTKVPKNPYTGGNAMPNESSTWSDYNTARSKSDKIGIQLGLKAGNLVGFDFDNILSDEKLLKEAKEFLDKANTYTEVSPSGNGLRAFLKTETPYKVLRNKEGIGATFEVYNTVRFLTVTETPFDKYNLPIRTVSHEELTSILEMQGYPWGKTEETPRPLLNYNTVTTLTDQQVLDIMFGSKINGDKIRQTYNTSQTDGVSELDASLCSHLAFYCDGYDQIERIWLSSPLGQRDKTKRKDYVKRTIENAMKLCTKHYEPSEKTIIKKEFIENMKEDELELLYVTDKNDKKITIVNTENVVRILKYHPEFKGKLRYDKFKNTLEIFRNDKWEEMLDHESINIQTRISVLFPSFLKVSKTMVEDALNKVIHDNEIRSVPDFIKSLKWDGVSRLDSWLTHAFGTANDEYHQKIGSNWMKGMVNRAINPGAKFDNVLVLEGKQGIKKSQALAMLGNINGMINHLETTMSVGNKDFFMSFVGKLIVEFSEGETLTRSETKQLKGIITTAYDNYREPYARKSKDHPRWCVFAMTTNEDTYLKDDTGNRRWLPVRVLLDECNIKWIEENREQLYAEAYHRVINLKESYWEFPKELLEEAQDERRVEDINADKVVEWYKNTLFPFERECGITVREVYDKVISKLDSAPYTPYEAIRIAGILKGSLKLTLKRKNESNGKINKWFDVQNRHQSISTKPEEEKKEIEEKEHPYGKEIEDEFEIDKEINKITSHWGK
jgi:predicted P-loop ATPase